MIIALTFFHISWYNSGYLMRYVLVFVSGFYKTRRYSR
jgi:hypothetical protein